MTHRMTYRMLALAAVTAFHLALPLGAVAQGPGTGPGRPAARHYDPASVVTVSGEVVGVERVPSPQGRGAGIHLALKTATETLSVVLGPSRYVDAQPTRIAVGDRVEVVGSRVTLQGKPVVAAAEVRKGDATLKLRNPDGTPLWSRRGAAPTP